MLRRRGSSCGLGDVQWVDGLARRGSRCFVYLSSTLAVVCTHGRPFPVATPRQAAADYEARETLGKRGVGYAIDRVLNLTGNPTQAVPMCFVALLSVSNGTLTVLQTHTLHAAVFRNISKPASFGRIAPFSEVHDTDRV